MAAVQLVALVLAVWTAVGMLVAVAVGRTLQRLEPIPVRVRPQRVVDLRRIR
jgi:hypothetical protein